MAPRELSWQDTLVVLNKCDWNWTLEDDKRANSNGSYCPTIYFPKNLLQKLKNSTKNPNSNT